MSYKPTETTIGVMLTAGRNQYIVPLYQREYSWGDDQQNDFWEDLEFVIKNKDRHFIGTIVLHKKNKDDDEAFIIDGQQRLASIAIIISCLRRLVKKYSLKEVGDFYLTSLLQTPSEKPKPRVVLSEKDKDIFKKFIIENNEIEKDNHLIVKASKFYLEKLGNLFEKSDNKDSTAKDILDALTKRLDIIQIIVETDEEGYSIFESINSTGKELGISDLFKNHVFGISQEKKCLDEVRKLWQEIIEEVSEKHFINFLKHYYMSKKKYTTEKRTYKDLKKYHLVDYKENILEFMKDLKNESLYYSFLVNPDNSKLAPEYDNETIDVVNGINSMDVNQCYPFLLGLLAKTDKKIIKDISTLIKKFLFRYTTCNLNPNVFAEIFINRASKLRSGEKSDEIGELRKMIKKYNPKDEDFENKFITLNTSKEKLQKYILSEIENSLSKTGIDEKVIAKSITIEHVLPKNPDKSWATVYDLDNKEHKDYVNRIGNLTLLSRKINPKLGNKSFEEKATNKEGYENSEMKLTQQLVKDYYPKYIKWDKNAVEQRQKDLAKVAVKIWQI